MNFTKCEALGNEFIVLINTPLPSSEVIINICNKSTGPGGDGIIHITSQNALDDQVWNTTIVNSDGSNGGFSGNGLRCGALCLALQEDFCNTHELTFAITNSSDSDRSKSSNRGNSKSSDSDNEIITAIVGKSSVSLFFNNDYSKSEKELTDSMKSIDFKEILNVSSTSLHYLDIGNPHLIIDTCGEKVIFTQLVRSKLNELRQRNALLQGGINVSIINGYKREENNKIDTETNTLLEIEITTFERGVGITPSCGSAALASFIALRNCDNFLKSASFKSKGGAIELSEMNNEVIIRGNAKKLFDGTYDMVNNGFTKR